MLQQYSVIMQIEKQKFIKIERRQTKYNFEILEDTSLQIVKRSKYSSK